MNDVKNEKKIVYNSKIWYIYIKDKIYIKINIYSSYLFEIQSNNSGNPVPFIATVGIIFH